MVATNTNQQLQNNDLYNQIAETELRKTKMNKLSNEDFIKLFKNQSLAIVTTADFSKIFVNNNIQTETNENIAHDYKNNKRNGWNGMTRCLILIRNIDSELAEISVVDIVAHKIYADSNLKALTGKWVKIHISRIRQIVTFAGTDKSSSLKIVNGNDIEFHKLFNESLLPLTNAYTKGIEMIKRVNQLFSEHYFNFTNDINNRKSQKIKKNRQYAN